MLAEIYGWFTEGFDTADLQEAKALLRVTSRCQYFRPNSGRRLGKRWANLTAAGCRFADDRRVMDVHYLNRLFSDPSRKLCRGIERVGRQERLGVQ